MRIADGLQTLFLGFLGLLTLPKKVYSQESERSILSSFFNACNGENWIQNDNWIDSELDACDWFGVTCNEQGKVDMLRLRNNNIECEIPENIFYLSSLTIFDLNGNKGSFINFQNIDSERASVLLELNIADGAMASLQGIHEAFGSLTALNVGGNSMGGEFPTSVLELKHLTSLDLSHNSFSGTIPSNIGTTNTKLQNLLLSYNEFSGAIPTTVGNLRGLSRLTLQFNNLSGVLPSELSELASLTQISFSENKLSGPMLDFANSPFLLSIEGRNNMLTGTIPNTLLESVDPQYSMLTAVDLSNNDLTGAVPIALSRFSSLKILLFGNMMDEISEELCSQAGGWFFGEVGIFGCDAIMCAPGTFNVFGRQISESFPCLNCKEAIFYGSTTCSGSRLGVSENSKIILFGSPQAGGLPSKIYEAPDGDQQWFPVNLSFVHDVPKKEPAEKDGQLDDKEKSFNFDSEKSDKHLDYQGSGTKVDSPEVTLDLSFLNNIPKTEPAEKDSDLDDKEKSFNFDSEKTDEHLKNEDGEDEADSSEATFDFIFLAHIQGLDLTSPPVEGDKVIIGSRAVTFEGRYDHGRSMESVQKDVSISRKGLFASVPILMVLASSYFLL